MLNSVTFQRISEYARKTGKTVSAAMNEAVNDFMDSTGDLVVIEIERRQQLRTLQSRTRKPAEILVIRARL